MKVDLNNIESIKQADPSGYLPILKNTPADIKKVWEEFKAQNFAAKKFDKIVVCAMGGSAIGADMAKSVVEKYSHLPMQIVRDYQLPNWVDDKTLAIIISYSGNTEETISGFVDAQNRGAQIFCITSGGKLLELAQENSLDHFVLPPNMPPRTAWGHSFFVVLELLIKYEVLNPVLVSLDSSIQVMQETIEECWEDVSADKNEAKQIAAMLTESIPVVFAAEHLAAVARRWKGEFNENTKIHSFFDEVPELNHNAQQGLEAADDLKKAVRILILQSHLYHPRNQLRAQIIQESFSAQGLSTDLVKIGGKNITESICRGVIIGDYISVYLAFLLGHDPVPFQAIEDLKAKLDSKKYVAELLKK